MKIRIISFIEIALFISFSIIYFLQSRNILHFDWVLLILVILLGMLYFPLGFYTLQSTKFDISYSILLGLLISGALVATFFALLKVGLALILLMLVITLFLMAAFVPLIFTYILGLSLIPVLVSDKGITVRLLIYFLLMVYAFFTFDFQAL